MNCKHCGKYARLLESSHTCLGYFNDHEDLNGFFHDHDKNSIREVWECTEGHTFTCEGFNHCWCSWTSREPDKDANEYKKMDMPFAWKFGDGHAITNLRHIVQLQQELEKP